MQVRDRIKNNTHSVKVCVGIFGHVIVEDNVDTLDVHATAEQVGGHKDSLLEVLELLVTAQSETWTVIYFKNVHIVKTALFDNCKAPLAKKLT